MRSIKGWFLSGFLIFSSSISIAKVDSYEGEMTANQTPETQFYAIADAYKEKSVEEIFSLAEAGDVDAQNQLVWMYSTGLRVPEDYNKAFEWAKKAAEQDDAISLTLLGGFYFDNKGIPRDYIKARSMFERAASKNSTIAQFLLGYIYENGFGVERDYVQAREWYEKSAKLGHESAKEALEDIVFIAYSEGGVDVRASHLYKSYSENEVRAKLNYGETPLVLEGKIDSIGFTPILNRPALSFSVPRDKFAIVEAVFSNEDIKKLSDMNKGEIVKVVCRGGVKYSLTLVRVSGCVVP